MKAAKHLRTTPLKNLHFENDIIKMCAKKSHRFSVALFVFLYSDLNMHYIANAAFMPMPLTNRQRPPIHRPKLRGAARAGKGRHVERVSARCGTRDAVHIQRLP